MAATPGLETQSPRVSYRAQCQGQVHYQHHHQTNRKADPGPLPLSVAKQQAQKRQDLAESCIICSPTSYRSCSSTARWENHPPSRTSRSNYYQPQALLEKGKEAEETSFGNCRVAKWFIEKLDLQRNGSVTSDTQSDPPFPLSSQVMSGHCLSPCTSLPVAIPKGYCIGSWINLLNQTKKQQQQTKTE